MRAGGAADLRKPRGTLFPFRNDKRSTVSAASPAPVAKRAADLVSSGEIREAWARPALRRCTGWLTVIEGTEEPVGGAAPSLAAAYETLVAGLPAEPAFAGLEIVSSRIVRQGRSLELTLLVDREGGIDLATCERVAARINHALDAFADPYVLAVSSAGVDRPLVKPADYDRFRDRAVTIVTAELLEGRKTHRGTLRGVRDGAAILEIASAELAIPLEAIATANVDFDIRADLTRAKRERRDARKNR